MNNGKKNHQNSTSGTEISPNHVSSTVHTHAITAITETYRGQRDRGVVASAKASNSSSVLTYSKSRTVSNNYSVSIGFEKGVVDAKLGYNVTDTDRRQKGVLRFA